MQIPFRLPDRRLFAGIAIGVLIGVIGVGAVTAASPQAASPAPSAPTPATTTAGGAANGGPAALKLGVKLAKLRQAITNNYRVEVNATGKNGSHTILYTRGTIATTATTVTVTLPDNSTQTYNVDSSTTVREAGKTIAFSDLENGETAMVFGLKSSDGSYTAKLIRCVKEPKTPKPAASPTSNT